MSYSGQSGSNTPNLPAKPTGPLPSFDRHGGGNAQGGTAAMFKPRAVGGTNSAGRGGWGAATVSAPAVPAPSPVQQGYGTYAANATAYSAQPDYSSQYQQQYAGYASAPGYNNPSPAPSAAPTIKNPFAPPPVAGAAGAGGYTGQTYDPEIEQQMAQWQQAYMNKDGDAKKADGSAGGNANLTPLGARSNIGPSLTSSEIAAAAPTSSKAAGIVQGADGKQSTVVRAGGGKTWTDDSLLEWDPAHPRLFIGNLAGEVTDDSLYKAFSKYASIVKTKVVRDRRTTKSKGYGFVSFKDADDYLKAFKEMQGKYIGSHPVLIKKSNTEIKAVDPKKQNQRGKNGKFSNKNRDVTGANTGAGVKKGQEKTRNGMVLLG